MTETPFASRKSPAAERVTGASRGAARWALYFRERFPLAVHVPVIAVFSGSSVAYAWAATAGPGAVAPAAPAVAFVVALLLFLQLRILDEFKDFDDDRRYRPYRPVPRGIVTLRALGRLGLVAAALQVAASALLGMPAVVALVVVWAYAGLMAAEFFARNWLRARPAVYLASHMGVVPLVVAHGATCAGARFPFLSLAGFAAMSYFTFCVFEIGRKIRAPADEQAGVETYSAVWGRRRAVFAWLASMAVAGLFAAIAADAIDALRPTLALIPVMGLAVALSWRFLRDPKPGGGKAFLTVSGVWMVVGFLALAAGAGMRLQG